MSEVFRIDPRAVSIHGPGARYDDQSIKGRQNSEKDRQKGTHLGDEQKQPTRPSKLGGDSVESDEKHRGSTNTTDNNNIKPKADQSWRRDSPATEQQQPRNSNI